MTVPRVSIVVRTKDRPTLLARALDDILNQAFADWQVIVVNDGGDQEAVDAVIARLDAPLRGRCEVTTCSPSRGRAGAANHGAERATGDYVALHDDDDLWHPAFLQRTVDHLDHSDGALAVAVPTEIVVERAEGDGFVEVDRRSFVPPGDVVSLYDLLFMNRAVPIGMLLRRDALTALGGWDETLSCVEDWELNLRLATAGSIDYLRGETLAFWMQRPSVSDGPVANSMFSSADEHYEFDRLVRSRALHAGDPLHDIGHSLYLSKYLDERIRATEERLNQRLDVLSDDLHRAIEYYSAGATVTRAARRLRRRWGRRDRSSRAAPHAESRSGSGDLAADVQV